MNIFRVDIKTTETVSYTLSIAKLGSKLRRKNLLTFHLVKALLNIPNRNKVKTY